METRFLKSKIGIMFFSGWFWNLLRQINKYAEKNIKRIVLFIIHYIWFKRYYDMELLETLESFFYIS